MDTKLNNSARLKLVVLSIFVCLIAVALWRSDTLGRKVEAQTATPTPAVATPPAAAAATPEPPRLEGCIKCHNNIEPMHKYTATGDVYDKLVDGKDAQG
ncbi:MAG: hypothetical protein ABL959_25650, partial [Pyrinomonadaceae bacterium]